jgi:cold shock CspA family protein
MAYALRTFKGTVVRFYRERAYGYVRVDAPPREAHFHLRDFEECTGGDEIKEGTRLEFYLEQCAKGLNAIRCSILK